MEADDTVTCNYSFAGFTAQPFFCILSLRHTRALEQTLELILIKDAMTDDWDCQHHQTDFPNTSTFLSHSWYSTHKYI